MQFTHLHCHTQYSLLDGASSISGMVEKAAADNMKAIAITDHGNMFGAFKFVEECNKKNIKPIVGCEFYLVEDRHKKVFTKEQPDKRYHQLLLAKDQAGYHNLSKLCSLGFIQGMYGKYPRIDKEILLQYHEGLIATTCCLGAMIPQYILKRSVEEAEAEFKWWLDLFGEDYYIELQRHKMPEQDKVNAVLLGFAKKYNVKIIASNDSHYIDRNDSEAHDILLCINTGANLNQEKTTGEDDTDKRKRFAFPNDEFYFKTTAEMTAVFSDLPQAIDNTNEIVDKITAPVLKRKILLPNFPMPGEFTNADDYLRHLTFEGALKRYKNITAEIEDRLNYELKVVKEMGFAGYFLVVSDFIKKGKDMGVRVGPGRGSAAGSAIAYCIEITNIDPLKFNLLFERFLNPERISMPDIDTDFDDEGRQKVIDYVVEKYGKNQVAQIITFGTMAAKSAIKDVARVMEFPINDSNLLSKMVSDRPGITLKEAYKESKDLKAIRNGTDIRSRILAQAEVLEGSVRNTGVHAAGVIIAPDDLTKYIPIAVAKDSDLYITQFDGKLIEEAGMLKMDFLGITNLNNIRDTLLILKNKHGIDLNIDTIPEDDELTFKLFQRGDTVAIFQFESEGMQKNLKELKPTTLEDLIAMNALYRPGPMDFIPNYINRKHGREKVVYPHALLENLLKPTYGIMVYQEQIMQCAQIVAGYSLGGADLLRRAMGKKDKEKMAKERVKFVEGAKELHQLDAAKANEIFDVMERFAEYGFNRSHAAAYSVLAYQTAYLKAHYPAEYMAAVMSRKTDSVSEISKLTAECKRMGIDVLGPSVNESDKSFTVNAEGKIRFALTAIKGLGDAAVDNIIAERSKKGAYTSWFEFLERINLRSVNKKSLEALVLGGALDDFNNGNRAQYFATGSNELQTFIDTSIRHASSMQESKSNVVASLFGAATTQSMTKVPTWPIVEPWSLMEQLRREREVTGFYISGHPLDHYHLELENFTNANSTNWHLFKDKTVSLAGIVMKTEIRIDKNGNKYARFVLEDFEGSINLALFKEDYIRLGQFIEEGKLLHIKGVCKSRWNNPDEVELKISKIQLLSSIREKEAKNVNVKVNLSAIDDEFISQLVDICKHNPGNCKLQLKVNDPASQVQVTLVSINKPIDCSNDAIDALNELPVLSVGISA